MFLFPVECYSSVKTKGCCWHAGLAVESSWHCTSCSGCDCCGRDPGEKLGPELSSLELQLRIRDFLSPLPPLRLGKTVFGGTGKLLQILVIVW